MFYLCEQKTNELLEKANRRHAKLIDDKCDDGRFMSIFICHSFIWNYFVFTSSVRSGVNVNRINWKHIKFYRHEILCFTSIALGTTRVPGEVSWFFLHLLVLHYTRVLKGPVNGFVLFNSTSGTRGSPSMKIYKLTSIFRDIICLKLKAMHFYICHKHMLTFLTQIS